MEIFNLVKRREFKESDLRYSKTISDIDDNIRRFKHDFDNIITTIGGYVKTNDIIGLRTYYSQIANECQEVNNLYLLNPEVINNPGIYNLISCKYAKAKSKGIKVNLSFLLDLNKLNMKIYEFARILGILLDNAIEAAEKCDEKILNIDFRNDSRNNVNLVIIENTYNTVNENIDINKIFDKGFSSKAEHSGLGLYEIKKILNKNNNLNLYTTKDNKYFRQQLEIYY